MRIAITGGIAEGKSTVLRYLQEAGRKAVSVDDLARRVFQDSAVNAELAALVGTPAPLAPERLRDALAKDASLRRKVNSIMHPQIVALMRNEEAEFIEVPLLFETCLQGLFDRVWVVTCGREEQLRRLLARYGDVSLAKSIVSTQLTSRAKTPFSDLVVRTNEEPETVRRIVSEAVDAL